MSVCGYEEVEGLFERERERKREREKKEKNCHINQFEEAETSFVSASSSIHLEIISTCIKFRTYLFLPKKCGFSNQKIYRQYFYLFVLLIEIIQKVLFQSD